MARLARAAAEPIDLAANERRVAGERAIIASALADLIAARPGLVVDGAPSDIVENDRLQAVERAKLEQCDARLAVIRNGLAEEHAAAAHAAHMASYRQAETARRDGAEALAIIKTHVAGIAAARARLIEAKRIVAAANRALPPGCTRLVDPEGPLVDSGKPSILDQIRIPLIGVGA